MNPTWLYVAALYAVAIALARRSGIDIPWRVAATLYALVLLFLFRPMTGPYTNIGADILQLVPPWSASAPRGFDKYHVGNYELQDIIMQFAPWTDQVHTAWREGRLPLWNELVGCGMPLLANMQSGAFSPLRLLTIPLPLAYALTGEAAIKLLVALTFTFLFCRRRGYDVVPSLIGAISFGFGTFMTLWLHFPHAAVAAFLPAVFYGIDLLAHKRTAGRLLFAALLGPVLLAGGHPETAAHIVFFAALYALWTLLVDRVRCAGSLFAACIAALLLAAPILLPFVEIMRASAQYAVRSGGYAEGTAYSDFASLALLIHPRIYGERPGPLWHPALTENTTGFAGILGIGAWFALAARAIARRRIPEREVFFVVITLLVFLWIADVPVISAPFRRLFALALNARLRLFLTFFLAVLTAALLHFARRERPLFAVPAVAGAAGALVFVMLRTQFPGDAARDFAIRAMAPSFVVIFLAAFLPQRNLRTIAIALLSIAVYVELWAAGHSWHPVRAGIDLYPRTPLIEALLRRPQTEPYRVAGIGGALFPNTNAVFGIEDVRVHDPMTGKRYDDVAQRAVKGWDPSAYYQKWADADTPFLDLLNVRWVVTEPAATLTDIKRFALVYEGGDGRIYENKRALRRFFAPNGPDARISIAKKGPDAYALIITTPRPTLIASSIALWPGWRARIGNRSLHIVETNGAFLGFVVPPGISRVEVDYFPLSFYGSLPVSIVTLLALTIPGPLRRRLHADAAAR